MNSEPAFATKVSVVIPTFNQVAYIEQAIASIARQRYANLEIIVADDCSTDGTFDIAARFSSDPRVRLIRRERNLGRVANYRRALHEDASGDWVLMLDGDDYALDDDFITDAVAATKACENVVLVVGGCRMVEPDGRWRDVFPTRRALECVDGFEYLMRWGASLGVPHLAALYPRALAISLDFYRADIISSDWESLRRLALHGNMALVGKMFGAWRQHDTSQSRSATVAQRMTDLQNVDNAHADAIAQKRDRARADGWRKMAVAESVMLACRQYLLRGEANRAVELLRWVRAQRPNDFAACVRAIARRPSLWVWWLLSMLGGRWLTDAAWRMWKRIAWRA